MLEPRFDIDGGPYRGPGACIGGQARKAYGLHWRIFEVSGRTAWTAAGYGGQFVVVVPSLDLVMVVTHDTYHDAVMPLQRHLSPHAFLESFVLPGLADAGPIDRGCGHDLAVARVDGSDPLVVAPHPADDFRPEWSPDATRIAFVSERDLNAELYLVDRDGSRLRRLTFDWASDVLPRWSPDGTRIAFLSDREAGSYGGQVLSDVHVLDLASGAVHRVSTGDGDAFGFTWSPDGERIAYVRSPGRDALGPVWVVDAEGRSTVLHPGPVAWPSWGPDGTRLAVLIRHGSDDPAPWRLAVLEIASGSLTELGPAADLPAWTGDGSGIVTAVEGPDGPVTVLVDPATGERTAIVAKPEGRMSPDGAWLVYPERPRDLVDGT
jgi:Tol biopolymer transport system component